MELARVGAPVAMLSVHRARVDARLVGVGVRLVGVHAWQRETSWHLARVPAQHAEVKARPARVDGRPAQVCVHPQQPRAYLDEVCVYPEQPWGYLDEVCVYPEQPWGYLDEVCVHPEQPRGYLDEVCVYPEQPWGYLDEPCVYPEQGWSYPDEVCVYPGAPRRPRPVVRARARVVAGFETGNLGAISRTWTVSACFAPQPCMWRIASMRAGMPAGSIRWNLAILPPPSTHQHGPHQGEDRRQEHGDKEHHQ